MAGRPFLSPSGDRSSAPRAVRLPPELAHEVDVFLGTHDMRFSELVRAALQEYLARERTHPRH